MSIFQIVYVLCLAIQLGFYFSFSNTIMPVLGKQAGNVGQRIMQDINKQVENDRFLGTFFAPIFLYIAMLLLGNPIGWQLTLSFIIYFIGVIGVTVSFSMPLNRQLANRKIRTDWTVFVQKWTRWNHVRTGAALIALALAIF
ncbi:anthrone oxygenase family protein [Aerococcaceae bacterium 50-4]